MGNPFKTLIRILGYTPYFRRPILWPEFGRRALRKLGLGERELSAQEMEDQRQQAEAWCKSVAEDYDTLMQKLFGKPVSLKSLKDTAPEALKEAEERAANCPVQMGGPGNLDLLYTLCETLQVQSVVETGVAYGWSSLAILISLKQRSPARLYSVDLPYMEKKNDPWVGVVIPDRYKDQWELFRMADREGLPRALRKAGHVDLVHYDSDKNYGGRMWAYPKIWESLRSGGLFLSDDIGDNMAFYDFCQSMGQQPAVIADGDKYQGILLKP